MEGPWRVLFHQRFCLGVPLGVNKVQDGPLSFGKDDNDEKHVPYRQKDKIDNETEST